MFFYIKVSLNLCKPSLKDFGNKFKSLFVLLKSNPVFTGLGAVWFNVAVEIGFINVSFLLF